MSPLFFFFNDTATTEIYPLSLHDALPISATPQEIRARFRQAAADAVGGKRAMHLEELVDNCASLSDRKSTRLNSSHANISYAVFCLKKKRHRGHYPRILPSHADAHGVSGT